MFQFYLFLEKDEKLYNDTLSLLRKDISIEILTSNQMDLEEGDKHTYIETEINDGNLTKLKFKLLNGNEIELKIGQIYTFTFDDDTVFNLKVFSVRNTSGFVLKGNKNLIQMKLQIIMM